MKFYTNPQPLIPGLMTSPSFFPVLLQPSNISFLSSGRTMGPAADWDGNPDEADSSRIDRAAGFLLPLLRSGASGLISCCRPPLWPVRQSSQNEELLGSNFGASPIPCAYKKPGNNAEHWEQLTLSLFLCLATKIANEPLGREKQNKWTMKQVSDHIHLDCQPNYCRSHSHWLHRQRLFIRKIKQRICIHTNVTPPKIQNQFNWGKTTDNRSYHKERPNCPKCQHAINQEGHPNKIQTPEIYGNVHLNHEGEHLEWCDNSTSEGDGLHYLRFWILIRIQCSPGWLQDSKLPICINASINSNILYHTVGVCNVRFK